MGANYLKLKYLDCLMEGPGMKSHPRRLRTDAECHWISPSLTPWLRKWLPFGNLPQLGLVRNSASPLSAVAAQAIFQCMSTLLVIAIGLIVLWAILRIALAITSALLHLLWIAAIVLAVLWLVGNLRGLG